MDGIQTRAISNPGKWQLMARTKIWLSLVSQFLVWRGQNRPNGMNVAGRGREEHSTGCLWRTRARHQLGGMAQLSSPVTFRAKRHMHSFLKCGRWWLEDRDFPSFARCNFYRRGLVLPFALLIVLLRTTDKKGPSLYCLLRTLWASIPELTMHLWFLCLSQQTVGPEKDNPTFSLFPESHLSRGPSVGLNKVYNPNV